MKRHKQKSRIKGMNGPGIMRHQRPPKTGSHYYSPGLEAQRKNSVIETGEERLSKGSYNHSRIQAQ